MPHKLHHLFIVIVLGLCLTSAMHAQTVRNFTLPVGPPYVYTEHLKPEPGYSFIASYKFTAAANYSSTLLIMDDDGAPTYLKERGQGEGIFADFRIYENGLMSYFRYDQATDKGKYMIMDSTFSIIDSVECAQGLRTDGHDMLMLGNGNYLILCLEEKVRDLSALRTIDNIPGYSNALVVAPVIQELDADRNVLFQWHGIDYYALSDIDSYFFLDPDYLDFGHANALSEDLDGNILLSLRFFNEITKINRNDSSIIWRLGGKNNDFTFVNDTGGFTTQHHCTVLPNGNIILYDNSELGNPPSPRGVEYVLNTNTMTATKAWEYINATTTGYSYAMGGMDRVSENGNSVIAWGAGYNPGFTNDIVEVTYDGQLVSEFDWPQDYFAYRVFKRTPSWDLEKLRPAISCDTIGGNVVLTATSNYQHYLWNTGDTSQSIIVTEAGEYYVLVENPDDSYFGSRLKKITDLASPCSVGDTITDTTSIDLIGKPSTLNIYPNPAQHTITIANTAYSGAETLVVLNTLGEIVFTKNALGQAETINVAHLPNGTYVGIVSTNDGKILHWSKFVVFH